MSATGGRATDDSRPILVTGIHRSGTGWVSQVLASSGRAAYLWEPFSPLHRPGVCAAKFPHWFTYVCADNGQEYVGPIQDMLRFRYRTRAELAAVRSAKDLARLVRDRWRFGRYRARRLRPLLKDPIAVFSAEWLHRVFDMDVIVLIRHPAAFVSSLKKHALRHPFEDFLRQPLLLRDWLGPFEAEIREQARREGGVIEQGILLWKLVHHVILSYRERHPDWVFVRLEDLARDPERSFRRLFDAVGLPFTGRVERRIEMLSGPGNPVDPPSQAAVRRDSRAAAWAWKSRLTAAEIREVRRGVEDLSRFFYSQDEW